MKLIACCVVCCVVMSMNAFGAVDSTGIKLLSTGKIKQAQEFFASAVKRNPRDAESQYYLSLALLRQGKFDEASDAIDEALDINEKLSKYHYTRGMILGEKALRANVFSKGIMAPKIKNAFKRSVELDPKNIDGHIGLFNYYSQAPGIMGGSDEKAMEEAKIVVELNPYRGHLMLGSYYQHKKDAGSADAEYQKMIAADPKNPDGRYRYGMFLHEEKRDDQAYAQLQKIIDNDPKDFNANYLYGRAMFNMDQWDKAIEKFQYVLYVEKDHPSSIWMLANCYEKKGMTAKAKETYQWFLKAEPDGRRAEMAQQKIKDLR